MVESKNMINQRRLSMNRYIIIVSIFFLGLIIGCNKTNYNQAHDAYLETVELTNDWIRLSTEWPHQSIIFYHYSNDLVLLAIDAVDFGKHNSNAVIITVSNTSINLFEFDTRKIKASTPIELNYSFTFGQFEKGINDLLYSGESLVNITRIKDYGDKEMYLISVDSNEYGWYEYAYFALYDRISMKRIFLTNHNKPIYPCGYSESERFYREIDNSVFFFGYEYNQDDSTTERLYHYYISDNELVLLQDVRSPNGICEVPNIGYIIYYDESKLYLRKIE